MATCAWSSLDYGKKTIQVQTYSPYLQQYLTDDANQFTLDLTCSYPGGQPRERPASACK